MSIHSKFLVHWTGKDFDPVRKDKRRKLTDDIREGYIKRLRSCCEGGLWMQPDEEDKNGGKKEKIYGRDNSMIWANNSRVCFTEIRLSQIQRHTYKYGQLGIGFSRKFVIERMGNPVLYVQNADTGFVVQNFRAMLNFFQKEAWDLLRNLSVILDKETSSSFNCYDDLQKINQSLTGKVVHLENVFATTLSLLKGMSEEKNSPDFNFYEEMEWRIVFGDMLERKHFELENGQNHIYRLKVKPTDVQLLIFPDEPTKQMAIKEDFLKEYFKDHVPMMATVEDCKDF